MLFLLVVYDAERNHGTRCTAWVSWTDVNLKNWEKFTLKKHAASDALQRTESWW